MVGPCIEAPLEHTWDADDVGARFTGKCTSGEVRTPIPTSSMPASMTADDDVQWCAVEQHIRQSVATQGSSLASTGLGWGLSQVTQL